MSERGDIQINVKIPKEMNDKLEKLLSRGIYATKSEAIRDAIRQLLASKE